VTEPLLNAPCPYCGAAAGEPCHAVVHPRAWGKATHYRRITEALTTEHEDPE